MSASASNRPVITSTAIGRAEIPEAVQIRISHLAGFQLDDPFYEGPASRLPYRSKRHQALAESREMCEQMYRDAGEPAIELLEKLQLKMHDLLALKTYLHMDSQRFCGYLRSNSTGDILRHIGGLPGTSLYVAPVPREEEEDHARDCATFRRGQ